MTQVGAAIRRLRLEKGLTQSALARRLLVTDKAVSKWETGHGLPDVSLLPSLSRELGADLSRLIAGEMNENDKDGGSMKNTATRVCPVCGNLVLATGGAEVCCCGRQLPALQPQKAAAEDRLRVEEVEDEWYVSTDHPMTRENSVLFIALLTGDRVNLVRQYPEWEASARFPKRGHGKLLWYATDKGLLYQVL